MFFLFSFPFFLSSCGGFFSEKSFKERAIFEEGKGYCVQKYDELGCNLCDFEHMSHGWDWVCTTKGCVDVDRIKQAHKCLKYKPKWKILLGI